MNVAGLFNSIFSGGDSAAGSGLVEISGVLNGSIRKGNEVYIMPSGRFFGKIEARKVEIAGVAQGDVEAENLVIHSSGQLYYGILKCQHVSVKNGGIMVKKDEKESDKAKDGVVEGHPSDTSGYSPEVVTEGSGQVARPYPSDSLISNYIPEVIFANSVEFELDSQERHPITADGRQIRADIPPVYENPADVRDAKLLQDVKNDLHVNIEKPHRERKQPLFYSSY